jgi:hypothetical protein
MDKTLKIVLVLIGLFMVLPVVIWLIFVLNRPIETGIRFLVVPDGTTAQISDKSIKVNYGTVADINPGSYKISFSREGFDTLSTDVVVEAGQVSSACVQLTPNSDSGKDILSKQKDLQARLNGVFGCKVQKGGEEIEKTFPFVNLLPVIDKYFSANACKESADENSDYIICVSLVINNSFQKKRAVRVLESKGIDTSSIKLRYLDFNNNT